MAECGTGKPVVLVVLDGWGIGRDEPGNAVLRAETPTMDRLWATYPHTTLRTAGEDVGLPAGQMGNSEVGHLNLGAGFVVYQWLTRLDRAIGNGTFFANPILRQAMARVRGDGGALHLIGLVSEGGVHSHVRHLEALLRMAKREHVERVAVHAITDGRDTPPTSGARSITDLDAMMHAEKLGRIATVCGRYWAMDRDHRWERTARAYDAIVRGIGERAPSAEEAVARSYAAGVTDEFIAPTTIDDGRGPVVMQPGDAVICFNFRADRMRQLVEALSLPDFHGFDRGPVVPDLFVATMARYEAGLPVAVAFEPHDVVHPLAGAIADAGLAQFHAAETEKYAHVTFFLNGGREAPFPGEERVLVPSPKVATYDLLPAMSALAVTDAVVAAIRSGAYAFVIVNYANGDMVGHTGSLPAAIQAVETVDRCLGEVVAAALAAGGVALVTADHGNAEAMIDPQTGLPLTAHTTNPVPFILVAPDDSSLRHARLRPDGRLAAVAPTVLGLLGLSPPPEMTEPDLMAAGSLSTD
ncbi:MAG TPA: 2,3-bisphosphoglycerate-independent phosphoglycerate mutase [Thermomicrobiales bacterium]|nr:2,3-bisphosphoglycerate-independent phosphoglycerate mutase [Thermomicrobiales bacterium]